jgi:hypothetical protein
MWITFPFSDSVILVERRELCSVPHFLLLGRLGVMLSVVLFNELSIYIPVVSALRMMPFWDQPAS